MSSGDQDLQTARGLHQQGRLPEALAMLDAVLARRPEEVEALLRNAIFGLSDFTLFLQEMGPPFPCSRTFCMTISSTKSCL